MSGGVPAIRVLNVGVGREVVVVFRPLDRPRSGCLLRVREGWETAVHRSFVLVLVSSCPLSRPLKLATRPGRLRRSVSASSGFAFLRSVLPGSPRSLRASRCAYFGKTRRSLCTGLRGGSPTGGRCFAIGHSPNRGSRFVAVEPSLPRGNARVKFAWEARSSGVTPARRSSARETRRAGGTP